MALQTFSGHPYLISQSVRPGGAAGDHQVPSIRAGDTLVSVRHVSGDFVTNADLTSEFSIPAGTVETINNAAGTDTTGDFLIVTFARQP